MKGVCKLWPDQLGIIGKRDEFKSLFCAMRKYKVYLVGGEKILFMSVQYTFIMSLFELMGSSM